jgi:antitoxin component of RelBE/YafQ-DinJ toxin-antitoxin module
MTTQTIANTKTLVSFKIDKNLKESVVHFCEEIGIPFSVLLNSLLKQVSRTKKIELESSFNLNPESVKDVLETREDFKGGKLKKFSYEDFIKKAKTGKL